MIHTTTQTIKRAGELGPMAYTQAMTDPEVPHVWQHVAAVILSGSLELECHEAVVPEWADGDEMPCNSNAVVGFRSDGEGAYPVCGEHMREPMVPLRAQILGES